MEEKLRCDLQAATVRAAGLQLQGRHLRRRAEQAEEARAAAEVELAKMRAEVRALRELSSAKECCNCQQKRKRPPVPGFKVPSPAALLRQIPLPPRKELLASSAGPGDEGFLPQWSGDYVTAVERQAAIDPDTIFGSSVPACDLDVIFPSLLFREAGLPPSKKLKRSDSGDGELEAASQKEILDYKRRMGHAKSWKDAL
mmetsp:Transcript_82637/g.145794  ORF Transcript_82637/g.145794 Transcript_82637/m.145794 type:complete len:199 (-) Transcript_82637:170-766(-)